MKTGLTVIADKMEGLSKALQKMTENKVMAGIPAANAQREDTNDKATINNAAIGYIMENGAPEMNIPARPFMVPGIKSRQDEITKRLQSAGVNALSGDDSGFNNELEAAGLTAQSAIQNQIRTGTYAPLAESTIRARRLGGSVSQKPLIDTGQLLASITYVIRKIKS